MVSVPRLPLAPRVRDDGASVVAVLDIDVSSASPEEIDRLVAGARAAYSAGLQAQRGFSPDAAAAKALSDVAELLPDGPETTGQAFLSVRRGDEVLGGVWVAQQGPDRGGGAWVYHLEVWPEFRRRGVAARLLRAAAVAARERGATHLGLNVFGDNAGAIALYEALGYRVTAQQMVLPLDGS